MAETAAKFNPLEWTDSQVASFWDFHARQAEGRAAQHGYFSAEVGDHVAAYLASMGLLQPGARVLDFGCGTGHFLEALAKRQGRLELHGVDFSADSIAETSHRLASRKGFVEARAIQQLPSPWAAGSFDLITSLEVVEHLDDAKLDGFLEEAARLLRPGGRLFVTTPNDENLQAGQVACPNCHSIFHRWQHVRTWTAGSLIRHVAPFGFSPVRVEATNFEPRLKNLARRLLRRRFGANLVGVFIRGQA
jgi:2-polyprenyl-3-methyl-5-hydroxy-6-metoxy-1,4-benzoquinol methylase